MSKQVPTAKLLNALVAKYQTEQKLGDGHIELEIRLKKVNRDVFSSVYKALLASDDFDKGELSCTISIVSNNVFEHRDSNIKYVREIAYDRGVKVGEKLYSKNIIHNPVFVEDYINYGVTLSREKECADFKTPFDAMVRFKHRVSFNYLKGGEVRWRFDLTAIRSGPMSTLGSQLVNLRNQLFVKTMTPETFLDDLRYDLLGTESTGQFPYEIEIEYIGNPDKVTPDDLSIIKVIFAMIDSDHLRAQVHGNAIKHIAELIAPYKLNNPNGELTLKDLQNNVKSITKNDYAANILPEILAGEIEYYVTDKADGVRTYVNITDTTCFILTQTTIKEIQTGDQPAKDTIVDAEMVDDKLYIFDVMAFEGEILAEKTQTERFNYLDKATALVNKYYPAVSKRIVLLDPANLEKSYREVLEGPTPYHKDGCIIIKSQGGYLKTVNYKYKPASENSIDFMPLKCPRSVLGTEPYRVIPDHTLWLLHVGISTVERVRMGLRPAFDSKVLPLPTGGYGPIQFSPSANPFAYLYYHPDDGSLIEGKIIELVRVGEDNHDPRSWKFLRVRDDKTIRKSEYGNNFRVAEITYINFINPFNVEDLWRPDLGYFEKTANPMYAAPNGYKRFVIGHSFKQIENSNQVIDMGSGRGADLKRYQDAKIKNILFIDRDRGAIAELVQRKYSFMEKKKKHFIGKWESEQLSKHGASWKSMHRYKLASGAYKKGAIRGGDDEYATTIYTMVADLTEPGDKLLQKIEGYNFATGYTDAIVCNFAFHYICDTVEHVRNILQLNSKLLKTGGLFMFSTFDGAKIFDLLRPLAAGEKWSVFENSVLKYEITKNFRGDTLASTGQYISVKLPMTDEKYDEPLCNISWVLKEAKEYGFTKEKCVSFADMLPEFAKANSVMHSRLTPDDIHYIGLHSLIILKKTKKD